MARVLRRAINQEGGPVTRTLVRASMLCFAATMLAAPALAQDGRAGVVTTLEGKATVVRAAAAPAAPVALRFKDDVFVRDRITTAENSAVRILLGGKAVITVRERTVLTITESPGLSTIDLASGRIGLAVAKDQMRRGEAVEVRTPNAVAGVRGTVLIVDTRPMPSRAGATADVATTVTVLKGSVEFTPRDLASGLSTGTPVMLGALESVGVTGSLPPEPVRTINRQEADKLGAEVRTRVREVPATATAKEPVIRTQIGEATRDTAAALGVAVGSLTSGNPREGKPAETETGSTNVSSPRDGMAGGDRAAPAPDSMPGSSGGTVAPAIPTGTAGVGGLVGNSGSGTSNSGSSSLSSGSGTLSSGSGSLNSGSGSLTSGSGSLSSGSGSLNSGSGSLNSGSGSIGGGSPSLGGTAAPTPTPSGGLVGGLLGGAGNVVGGVAGGLLGGPPTTSAPGCRIKKKTGECK
jgi:X-X-X-Leu-X-X-Gly heptad repeat protein